MTQPLGVAVCVPSNGGARRHRLTDGRWHFQHGPIDCIIGADGDASVIAQAVEAAWLRFGDILAELVAELPVLRTDLASAEGATVQPRGAIARRMVAVCRAHASEGRFITAMAAVAGSVAEELIAFFGDARITRAYVNNGGDIALHLSPGQRFEIGWVADIDAALEARHRVEPRDAHEAHDPHPANGPHRAGDLPQAGDFHQVRDAHDAHDAPDTPRASHVPDAHQTQGRGPLDGSFRVTYASGVRGIATSGWRGRSFSLGIADSVTVLAPTASMADAAATVIANAVDADDARIRRAPANRLRDDSDLGERLVTCAVPQLSDAAIARALAAGAAAAEAEIEAGRATAAALCLQGAARLCGGGASDPSARARSSLPAAFDTLAVARRCNALLVEAATGGASVRTVAPPSIRI